MLKGINVMLIMQDKDKIKQKGQKKKKRCNAEANEDMEERCHR